MPWVRVDDQFPDHPKVVAAGPAAAWLYVTALCYCNRMLTDGFIPDDQVPRLAPSGAKLAPRLVEVGLWRTATRQGIEGFEVHDYHVYQPTREEVMEDRRKAAQRQQRARERATQVRAARHGVSHGGVTATSRRDSRPRHDDVTVPPIPIPSTDQISKGSVPHAPPVPRERARAPERVTAVALLPKNTRWAGRPVVPDFVHAELLQRLAPDETEADLLAFYARTAATWADRPIGDDNPRFWRARFSEWKGSAPGTAVTKRQAISHANAETLRRVQATTARLKGGVL